MTDRPIIFSAPMIRALLDGRKTQTRRVLYPQPRGIRWAKATGARTWDLEPESNRCTVDWTPPRDAPGDRLWVREAWTDHGLADGEVIYRATAWDDTGYTTEEIANLRWRPSIHMPRRVSRLTLIVTDVRVQRLQEITEADAVAEGIRQTADGWSAETGCGARFYTARDGFHRLWNSLHGPDAWDANPWVYARTFTVHRCNIDEMVAE